MPGHFNIVAESGFVPRTAYPGEPGSQDILGAVAGKKHRNGGAKRKMPAEIISQIG